MRVCMQIACYPMLHMQPVYLTNYISHSTLYVFAQYSDQRGPLECMACYCTSAHKRTHSHTSKMHTIHTYSTFHQIAPTHSVSLYLSLSLSYSVLPSNLIAGTQHIQEHILIVQPEHKRDVTHNVSSIIAAHSTP